MPTILLDPVEAVRGQWCGVVVKMELGAVVTCREANSSNELRKADLSGARDSMIFSYPLLPSALGSLAALKCLTAFLNPVQAQRWR